MDQRRKVGRSQMAAYYLTAGISGLALGLTMSYLMVYLHDGRGISLVVAGLALSGGGLSGFIFSAMAGTFIDRIGPLRSLQTGMVLQGLSAVAVALVRTVPEAFLAVAFAGMGPALFWPSQASMVAALVSGENRSRSFATQFMIVNAGVGIGEMVSGSVIHLYSVQSYVYVYVAEALILFIAPLLLGFSFRNVRVQIHNPTDEADVSGPVDMPLGYRSVFANRSFRSFMYVHVGFVFFGYSQLEAAWAAYATQYAGATPRVVGLAFAANTGVIVLAQLYVGRLIDRFRRSRALVLAALGWVVTWLMAFFASFAALRGFWSDAILVCSLGVFGLAETVYAPVDTTLVNDLAPSNLRGRYNAVSSSGFAFASLFAAPLAGILLGSGISYAWVIPMVVGSGGVALKAARLSGVLPPEAEAPRTHPI